MDSIAENATGQTVAISLREIPASALTAAQQSALKELNVLLIEEVAILDGTVRLSEFGGTATVSVPYTLWGGQKETGIVAWYLAGDGGRTEVPGSYLDGAASFTVTRLSDCAVAYDEEKAARSGFEDVAEDSYYYDAVTWAVSRGITEGTGSTTFSPEAVCTRAQMVTFLWRAAGRPEPVSTEHPFTNLEEASYCFKAVLWAFENGIARGTSDTTFGPNDTVTRGQAVTFLFRALNAAAGAENPFTDVREEAYYYHAVLWAYENGVTRGNGDTTFGPADACLRAHIVTFLYRAYGSA